jgi:predicted nucleic acid-binding protein
VFFAYLDASALAKRYYPEVGSAVVDHLFLRVPQDRMLTLSVGLTEVASVLARKRNAGRISATLFLGALRRLRAEAGPASPVRLIEVDGHLAEQAFDFVDIHSLNATDAVLLRSALDLTASLRASGDDLLLVASDQRLLRAARAEGLAVFNPETQSESNLDALLGP